MIFLLKYWKLIAIALLCASLVLYGYRWGARSVEAEYDALRAAQRANAQAASDGYQEYRRKTDMTKIRKEMNHEITNGSCIVVNGNWMRLYEAAGVRDSTP
jgi:membrane protein required for beta-lactamase induction